MLHFILIHFNLLWPYFSGSIVLRYWESQIAVFDCPAKPMLGLHTTYYSLAGIIDTSVFNSSPVPNNPVIMKLHLPRAVLGVDVDVDASKVNRASRCSRMAPVVPAREVLDLIGCRAGDAAGTGEVQRSRAIFCPGKDQSSTITAATTGWWRPMWLVAWINTIGPIANTAIRSININSISKNEQ